MSTLCKHAMHVVWKLWSEVWVLGVGCEVWFGVGVGVRWATFVSPGITSSLTLRGRLALLCVGLGRAPW